MIRQRIRSFFNPEWFQGWGKTRKYFEGWYFKLVTADEQRAFAIIPGIAMDENGRAHSFIQCLDGKNKTSRYFSFEAAAFRPSSHSFQVSIGENRFSDQELKLAIPGLAGELKFSNTVGWPKPFYSPGIMGPYAFAPFMECYHGIVSMDHSLSGRLQVDGKEIDFDGGGGYIEKDWGRSFPSAYFWMQSNHFSQPGTSLKASVARIPWIRKAFTGFIAGLWWENRLYRFTTYNGTVLKKSFADEKQVHLVMENRRYGLEITAQRDQATGLASPILGFMNGRIEESMTARLDTRFYESKTKKILMQDQGRNAGLEVAGEIGKIFV